MNHLVPLFVPKERKFFKLKYKFLLFDLDHTLLDFDFGIEKDGAYLAERYQFFLSKQGQTFPGVEDLLKKLISKGYELYAATNGITYIQTGRLEQSGIAPFFKEIFISEQLHTQKPDAEFYEKIGTRIPNFDKNQTLMIGDSLSADIQGGNNAGIDTIWYNPHHLENKTQAQPTYEVDSYQALLDCLGLL